MVNPTDTSVWDTLKTHSAQFKHREFRLQSLFETGRFEQFSTSHEALLLDYSKQFLTQETIDLLLQLADESKLQEAIDSMFAGDAINTTENRAVLHTALRQPPETQPPEVAESLAKMSNFVEEIRSGAWRGASNSTIVDIVNIGIGGSDLGPAFVVDALGHFRDDEINLHFVSNVDPIHMQSVLNKLDAGRTLFIIASKSFGTLETRENANLARQWFLDQGFSQEHIAAHFVATTTNRQAAEEFGISSANLFPMWDWVGGRYSLWSAIGLPIALACGMENFNKLLAGAHSMDEHFRKSNFSQNLPVLSALIALWYINFFDAPSTAIVPYSQRLDSLPIFLQQLYMESLGKSVDLEGNKLNYRTGETLWGSAGTNSQHSYFQLLHQGREFIPVEFIAFSKPENSACAAQHNHLLANCLSQSKALMEGDLQQNPHRNITGNKPSSTLLIEELTPYNLGSLIAFYEHRVFVQSVIWNINAFDQWGVQLGKILSEKVIKAFNEDALRQQMDESTSALITKIQEANE
ncbi:MAG: glucose-6-phosphate isomerase [Pseudohongiellaceae bacterium]